MWGRRSAAANRKKTRDGARVQRFFVCGAGAPAPAKYGKAQVRDYVLNFASMRGRITNAAICAMRVKPTKGQMPCAYSAFGARPS
jgi:hypothetical protein